MAKRTARVISGTEVFTKNLEQLLPEFMKEISRSSVEDFRGIFQAWFQLLGETMGPLTEPVSFIDGVLKVKVKSSTLYSLLATQEKKRILSELQKQFPIRDIALKVG